MKLFVFLLYCVSVGGALLGLAQISPPLFAVLVIVLGWFMFRGFL